jgi:predicted DNA-binding transcriptional regulator AlpA
MTAEKLRDHFAYPPRTFRAEEAARYFSMSISSFLKLVAEGVMPRGIKVRGMTMWDRHELDSAWENLKEQQGARRSNPIAEHYGINGER